MIRVEADGTAWRKIGADGGENGVEVAFVRDRVHLRGSLHRGGPILKLTAEEFGIFARGVREGEFDALRWS